MLCFIFIFALKLMCIRAQNFMSGTEFCFRICDPKGSNAPGYCQHIYDVMGCEWNMPANYAPGFDTCHADSGEVRPVSVGTH
jgi:hypothetical protein